MPTYFIRIQSKLFFFYDHPIEIVNYLFFFVLLWLINIIIPILNFYHIAKPSYRSTLKINHMYLIQGIVISFKFKLSKINYN